MPFPSTGPLFQVCFIVEDMKASIEWWCDTMSTGPWFVMEEGDINPQRLEHFDSDVPRFICAFAYSGDLCIELIEPRGPSIFDDYLESGANGTQHICMLSKDWEASAAIIKSRGGVLVEKLLTGGSVIGFFKMSGGPEVLWEVVQRSPGLDGMLDALKQASLSWDGKTRMLQLG